MMLLDSKQIDRTVMRLVHEIAENNYDEPELIIAGINNRGMKLATLLAKGLQDLGKMPIELTQIRLSPANPLGSDVVLSMPIEHIDGKSVLIVDDVANTGRTLFFACKPFLQILPRKVEIAVLVDRKHKAFPILVDYVGISLATTLQENIDVQFENEEQAAVYLD
jgi:pyrimidine operon attenuation protein/uracil phosphoribosyltransferase